MKVTFCAYDFVNKVGGPISWLQRLLPALCEEGLQVSLMLFSEDPQQSRLAEALAVSNVQVSIAPFSTSTKAKIEWILESIRAEPPDVFVANLCVPALFAAGWIRNAGIPTVGVLHSDDDFYREFQKQFVFGRKFLSLSAVVCVSKFLEAQLLKKQPPNTKVYRVPYGVPIPSNRVSPPTEALGLLYVGRLVEKQKRISRVVEAFCRASAEVPNVFASILGEGRKRTEVAQYIDREGMNGVVAVLGSVPVDQVQAVMQNHHVIVLLSDYEGLPISLLEAMACGLVPVSTAIRSGIPEIVREGQEGLLVDPKVGEFVSAIKQLRNDSKLWEQMSQNSQKRAQDLFGERTSALKWKELLVELARSSTHTVSIRGLDEFKLPRPVRVFAHEDFRDPPQFRMSPKHWFDALRKRIGR